MDSGVGQGCESDVLTDGRQFSNKINTNWFSQAYYDRDCSPSEAFSLN